VDAGPSSALFTSVGFVPVFAVLALLAAMIAGTLMAALALRRLASTADRQRHEATIHHLLGTFGSALAAIQQDPRQLLVWYPLAANSRKLFPHAFRDLDAAFGGSFPFSKDQIQTAHARCSSDWLTWERAHDAEFSLKAAEVEDEIARSAGPASPLLRTRLAAIEQQKLERYQQRYEEYIKTAKALAGFAD
jgi:hypothetical protein